MIYLSKKYGETKTPGFFVTDLKREHLLHEAVIKNDIAKVNSLLEANMPVNSRIHVSAL